MISALCKKSTWCVTSTMVLFFRAPLTHSCANIKDQSATVPSVRNLNHLVTVFQCLIKFSSIKIATVKLLETQSKVQLQ